MTLKEMKIKALGLIEELNPDNPNLTDDPDISAKFNEVTNQISYELARYKRIPRYVTIKVNEGQVIQFSDIEKAVGNEIYQVSKITGVGFHARANGTIFKMLEGGTAEIDCFVYPERITSNTKDSAYEFELSPDVLEIMPYGIAADLLKSDESAGYGTIYANRYESMKQMIDTRYNSASIIISGGYNI